MTTQPLGPDPCDKFPILTFEHARNAIKNGFCGREPLTRQLVIAAALLAVLLSSSAGASAAPTPDPIIGDWNVKYGAPAMVTMTLAGGVYTETAKTPVRVTGASCDLPAGTIIATFTQTGPGTYTGKHGLWSTNNCAFAYWTDATFNLKSDGNTMTANLGQGHETPTFTKDQSSSPTG